MSRIAVVLLALTVSVAQAKEKDFISMGAGTSTCGQFAAKYRQVPDLEISYFAWAQGYMSGINFTQLVAKVGEPWVVKNLASIPIEQQKSVIRRYCNDHPLEDYTDAVMHLYLSLEDSDHQARDINWYKK